MQTLFATFADRLGPGFGVFVGYLALTIALGLGGFVTGHFVGAGRVAVVYGAFVAVLFILITATAQATRDAIIAREAGFAALPPIDFLQLTVTDVLAMTGASCGAWLAIRTQTR